MKVLLLGGTGTTTAVGEACVAAGIELAGVVTVAPRFAISYAERPVSSARYADVGEWADGRGLPVFPFGGTQSLLDAVDATGADFGLVAGWYHMIPRTVRERFTLGCAGVHASLLPMLRGGAPLNWAILQGLDRTGVSLFELADGVDDGPVYGRREIELTPATTIGDLVALADRAAAALVRECLPGVANGTLRPVPQQGMPTYGLQRTPEDGRIDWRLPASRIDRLVRAASSPYPGAFTSFDGQTVRIWAARVLVEPVVFGMPGQLVRLDEVESGVAVVTREHLLAIEHATSDAGADVLPLLRKHTQRRFD